MLTHDLYKSRKKNKGQKQPSLGEMKTRLDQKLKKKGSGNPRLKIHKYKPSFRTSSFGS